MPRNPRPSWADPIIQEIPVRKGFHPFTIYLMKSKATDRPYIQLYKYGQTPVAGKWYHHRVNIHSAKDWLKVRMVVDQLAKFLRKVEGTELSEREIQNILKPLSEQPSPETVASLQKEIGRLRRKQIQSSLPQFRRDVREFEKLLSGALREKDIQKFVQKHYWVLGLEYIGAKPQQLASSKNRIHLLAQRMDQSFDIIELKLPREPLFQKRGKRTTITTSLKDAITQVIDYIDFYLEQRGYMLTAEDADIYKPRGIIIIGRRTEDEQKQIRKITFYLHNIEIITYDTLLDKAKRAIKMLSARRLK